MPTRRRALALAGGALVPLTGCLQGDGESTDENGATDTGDGPSAAAAEPTPPPANTPTVAGTESSRPPEESPPRTASDLDPDLVTRVPDDLASWNPDRWIETEYENVLGLDAAGGRLYVTLSDEDGDSAVAALSPGSDRFDWQTRLTGEATATSHYEPTNTTDGWGVTVADGTVYSVNGRSEESDWTTLHALDETTGRTQWTFERERYLRVAGFTEGAVVVTATEFFESNHSHDTPEEPLETTVYGLDPSTGDPRWDTSVDGFGAAAADPDGVYVAGGRRVRALAPSGDVRWRRELSDPVTGATVVDGVTVLSVGPNRLESTLVGLSDRTVQWRLDFETRHLLPAGDRVYVGNHEVGAVTADGRVAWRDSASGRRLFLAADGDRLYARTDPLMNAADAYALPGGDRQFRFVTPSNNGWPVAATADVAVAEAITPDRADFTSLFAVDASNGEPLGVYRPGDTVFSVLGHEGAVYAGFGDGRLGVFETTP